MTTEPSSVQLKVGDLVAKVSYPGPRLEIGTVIMMTKKRISVRVSGTYSGHYDNPRQYPSDWHQITEVDAEKLKALDNALSAAVKALCDTTRSYPAGKIGE